MVQDLDLTPLGIINLAVNKEKDSFSAFAKAAQVCSGLKLRRTLNQLALEELRHILRLMEMSEGLSGDPLEVIDLTIPITPSYTELLGQEEEVLGAAIRSERESRDFYRNIIDQIPPGGETAEVRQLLQDLIREEEQHEESLKLLTLVKRDR
ncbi:MAG: ferritin family protein [Candidatus Tectomicrobia bacterium]|uniref:Ferritin family protein n=1 Tax=Tectimicrobiota bacterium TaxID=2528274 RepID=A0A932GQX8_UNCTE|nr:ferritin family protein [Candidatus Tectomicrobia bacterium]